MDLAKGNPTMSLAALVTIALVLYFVPAFIAAMRGKRNAGAIFALNLLLGWTALGWICALVWALTVDAPAGIPIQSKPQLSLAKRWDIRRW
jgi:ABC-type transport system involved in cytochrome c biogenesis permease component